MSTLRTGQTIRHPPLVGTWAVWSRSGDAPGAYFVVPADKAAEGQGIKFAVIKATQRRESAIPELQLIRTDPHRPDLIPNKKRNNR